MAEKKNKSIIDTEDVRPAHTAQQGGAVSIEHDHEHSDVDIRAIIRYGVILLISLVVVHAILFGLWLLLEHRSERADAKLERSPVADSVMNFAGPRLQSDPARDMALFHQQEDSALNNYRLIDKGTGVVQLPIGQAIDMIAGQGLPTRTQPYTPELAPKEQDGGRYRPMVNPGMPSQIPGNLPSRDSAGAGRANGGSQPALPNGAESNGAGSGASAPAGH
jgi:hypothetical protein